jgi:hypothetical protein
MSDLRSQNMPDEATQLFRENRNNLLREQVESCIEQGKKVILVLDDEISVLDMWDRTYRQYAQQGNLNAEVFLLIPRGARRPSIENAHIVEFDFRDTINECDDLAQILSLTEGNMQIFCDYFVPGFSNNGLADDFIKGMIESLNHYNVSNPGIIQIWSSLNFTSLVQANAGRLINNHPETISSRIDDKNPRSMREILSKEVIAVNEA